MKDKRRSLILYQSFCEIFYRSKAVFDCSIRLLLSANTFYFSGQLYKSNCLSRNSSTLQDEFLLHPMSGLYCFWLSINCGGSDRILCSCFLRSYSPKSKSTTHCNYYKKLRSTLDLHISIPRWLSVSWNENFFINFYHVSFLIIYEYISILHYELSFEDFKI